MLPNLHWLFHQKSRKQTTYFLKLHSNTLKYTTIILNMYQTHDMGGVSCNVCVFFFLSWFFDPLNRQRWPWRSEAKLHSLMWGTCLYGLFPPKWCASAPNRHPAIPAKWKPSWNWSLRTELKGGKYIYLKFTSRRTKYIKGVQAALLVFTPKKSR